MKTGQWCEVAKEETARGGDGETKVQNGAVAAAWRGENTRPRDGESVRVQV